MGSGISRRTFFRRAVKAAAVVAAAATGVIDPEELLWTPTKKIFTPPAGGWPRGAFAPGSVVGVDYGYGESWSMLQEDIGPVDERIMRDAAKQLAEQVDRDILSLYAAPHAKLVNRDPGLSIRMMRHYDINSDRFPARLDVLYGMAVLKPDFAVRVVSDEPELAAEGERVILDPDWLDRFMARA